MRYENISSENICYIVGSMKMGAEAFMPKEGDLVIAADGGYNNLKKNNIKPDILLGDFDSIGEVPQDENIIRLPIEKNDTDTFYAVKLGLKKGYKKFVIYGGTGGRLDHTIANIQILAFLEGKKCTGYLIGNGTIITVIKDRKIMFSADHKGVISVFCYGGMASGVSLKGLKYPLLNYTMRNTVPLGVSNQFIGKDSSVEVRDGMLIVIWNDQNPNILTLS